MKKAQEIFNMVHEKVENRKKEAVNALRQKIYDAIDSMEYYEVIVDLSTKESKLIGELSNELREHGFRFSLSHDNDGTYFLITVEHLKGGTNEN